MAMEFARQFRADLDEVHQALISVPPKLADVPWREGGWTRKQIVGHLLDSAANNRQRFVRASTDGKYKGPKYSQDAWVAAHGYTEHTWETTAELVGGGTRDSDRGCGSHSRRPASDKLHSGWRAAGDAAISD